MALRILYVEDDHDLREVVELLLKFSGRSVTGCDSAEAAWQAVESQPFDVIITDLTLPQASGLELTQRLLARNPDQWVVLCSGAATPIDCAALGRHVRALTKPFAIEELEALLERIEAQARAASSDPMQAD